MPTEITLPHRFTPRAYQIPLFAARDNGVKRFDIVWHRRAGKDLTAIHFTIREMFRRPGLYWHMLPTYAQGKKIVWKGADSSGRPFLDAFPKQLLLKKNETDMSIEMMSRPDPVTKEERQSIYQVVGGDNYNTLVGANPVGIIFSEWSLTDPDAWKYIRPILVENGGWAMFIYTPRGHNHAYDHHQAVKHNPKWFCSRLTVEDTGAYPLEAIEEERNTGASEEEIQQEYYVSFEGAVTGSIYGDLMKKVREENRIREVTYNQRYPVIVSMDLGVNDDTVLWFFQEIGGNIHVIDFYRNSGLGISHYAKVLHSKPYVYGDVIGPWDLEIRVQGAEAKTRKQIFRELGIKVRATKKLGRNDGIEAVRKIFSRLIFDEAKCQDGIAGLDAYRREYDSYRRISGPPIHDWASHIADAMRVYAMGRKENDSTFGLTKKKSFHISQDGWNPFA